MKCDELKAFNCVDSDLQEFCEPRLVYLKSEADEVIAEKKDAEIERLEILCANYRHDCDNLAISNEQAKRAARTLLKKMNYNKYKRCLAMADKCESMCYWFSARFDHHELVDNVKWELFDRWRLRWAKLADKFKESK